LSDAGFVKHTTQRLDEDLELMGPALRLGSGDGSVDGDLEIAPRRLEVELMGLELGCDEEVVDKARQLVPLTRDHLEELVELFVGQAVSPPADGVDSHDDRGKRAPELMRGDRQEPVLDAIGLCELERLPLERVLLDFPVLRHDAGGSCHQAHEPYCEDVERGLEGFAGELGAMQAQRDEESRSQDAPKERAGKAPPHGPLEGNEYQESPGNVRSVPGEDPDHGADDENVEGEADEAEAPVVQL
jgi:hypothetical protein